MTTRQTGNKGEELVSEFLVRHGYVILERNYTVKGGEIDIISQKDGMIVFTEVKTRDESAVESGIFAVTKRKKRLIIRASQIYLYRNQTKTAELQPRFDAAEITLKNNVPIKLKYYPDAFRAEGSDIVL